MRTKRLPAVFMRGGTSRAVMFRREDLPADKGEWDAIFLAVMGSPDPDGRQLDGMGGGLSSLSKVCVVGPSSRPDVDVDFTFAQVAIDQSLVDYSGNCGNMSSAVGPFAVEEGMVAAPPDGEVTVRIHNTNTAKIIVSRFPVVDGALAPDGDLAIDGVAGTAAAIRLEFLDPGGTRSGRLLPAGSPQETLDIAGSGAIRASCVDASIPAVFVSAGELGKTGVELPGELEEDASFLETMERIRLAASVRMGIAPDEAAARGIPSIPKVAMIGGPGESPTLSGGALAVADMDIAVRMLSVGQPHRAVPITGAVCLAVAARIPGTVVHDICGQQAGPLRIGHASGTILVDAGTTPLPTGELKADYGAVYRTARRLFEGRVLYRAFQQD